MTEVPAQSVIDQLVRRIAETELALAVALVRAEQAEATLAGTSSAPAAAG